MKVRIGALIAVLLAAFAAPGLVPAAGAAAGDTIATFVVTAGTLSISVPASTVALATGTVNTGASSAAGQLGTVSVTDNRGALVAAWTATVSSTDFATGAGSSNEKVTAANVSYASGTLTTSGSGVFTPQVGAALGTPKTAASLAAGVGNNTASWNPTLTFTLQGAAQVAGTYTGTINHSVA